MKPPGSVLLLSDVCDPRLRAEVQRLSAWLQARGVDVTEAGDAHSGDPEPSDAELVLVLGGDGTFLQAVHRLAGWDVPFLGVRFGTFGYLAELEPDSWEDELTRLLDGAARVEHWMRLRCRIRTPEGEFEEAGFALNEVVVTSAEVATLLEIVLSIDGERITRYRGDGWIVATAVGSTAHSMAAGGPILEPTEQSFLLTPLASQALTYRPLVLRRERRVELVVGPSRHGTAVTIDGSRQCCLGEGARIEITASADPVRVATVVRRSRFRTLRERLHWGAPLVHRPGDEG